MGRWLIVVAAAGTLFGLAAVAGFAGTGGPGGTPAAVAFRLGDGSAGCNYRDSGEIACRAAGAAAAAVLGADGTTRVDDGVVAWDDSTPVLLASESWWNGSVRCRVASAQIVCSAGGGAIAAGADGARPLD